MNGVCDRDCFRCPHPDCICDELTLEDYKQEREIDLLSGARILKTPPKVAAASKRYYEKNKEKVAAASKRYYEKNKEKVAAASKRYREENKEKVAEYRKRYYERKKRERKANEIQEKASRN